MSSSVKRTLLTSVFALIVLTSCTSTGPLIDDAFSRSEKNSGEITKHLPDHTADIKAVKGKGRAILSEPDNTERITVDFTSDISSSLFHVKNRIGIAAGSMMVRGDSILIYNKIDKKAQLRPVSDARLTGVGELASMNMIRLLNYTVDPGQVDRVMESETHYLLVLKSGGQILIDKKNLLISEVNMSSGSGLPYSRIMYESYAGIETYTLPRKITIFSADGVSKILLQIRDLTINPETVNTELTIPEDIIIQRL